MSYYICFFLASRVCVQHVDCVFLLLVVKAAVYFV